MDRFLFALTAFGGGIIAALLGWCDSKEPFDGRQFGGSVIRSFIAGIIFAIGFNQALSTLAFFSAFLAGAGVDVMGNKLVGSFRRK